MLVVPRVTQLSDLLLSRLLVTASLRGVAKSLIAPPNLPITLVILIVKHIEIHFVFEF